MRYRDALPQLDTVVLTEGGVETTLVFHDGLDLPLFASFPLLEREDGRAAMKRFYEPYLELARAHGTGFVVDTATWRASPAWGEQLGYGLEALAEANRRAVGFAFELRDGYEEPGRPIVVNGAVGPHSDAYDPASRLDAGEAARYHAWQIGVLADAGVDLVSGLTLTYADEATGIVRAAEAAGVPVAVSFTVETDGRLPTGQPLAGAIEEVDHETGGAAAYFMVNCAHPTHFAAVFEEDGPWERILGIRANASTKSHAELDEAAELDDGDPDDLAQRYLELGERLPHLTVLGGCCGTDHRHVGRVADAWLGAGRR